MKINIHKSDSRGLANHGWLDSRHTYSFSNYHDPDRMGFGKLRVINDDIVSPAAGFGTHPHNNMEIISIPLRGSQAPEGFENNWLETIPGKGFFMVLRMYGPLEPWIEQTWRPSEIERVK